MWQGPAFRGCAGDNDGVAMAVPRSEETLKFFNANDVGELEVGTTRPNVYLTSHFAKGRKLASGRRLRRLTFLALASLLSGAMAFIIVGVSHIWVDGTAEATNGTYLEVNGLAAGLVAFLTWRSRADLARSANGYLAELIEAFREAFIVGVCLEKK